jgi:hypothetical protein
MSVADDYGRFHAVPKLLRASLYPLQIDRVSDSDIGKWITACVTAGLVRVYPASDGKCYIEILKFGQQVRARSKFPPPDNESPPLQTSDNSCLQPKTVVHLGGGVFEGEGEGSSEPPRASAEPAVLKFPVTGDPESKEWSLVQSHIDSLSLAFPSLDVLGQSRQALSWVDANPSKRKTARGMKAFLHRWMERTANKNGSNGNGHGPGGSRPNSLEVRL